MDPLRIAVRAVVAYVFLLALLRVSGKHSLRRSTPFEFVLALLWLAYLLRLYVRPLRH